MTYPQCPVQPDEALALLRACHAAPIKDWIVAAEAHQDGTPHLHAFIRYETRVTWKADLWDLKVADKVYHGNYQQAKSWKAVIQYCKKDGHYISNVSIEDANAKKAARNKQLLEEDPKQLIESGTIGVLQLPGLIRAKATYTTLLPPLEVSDVRGIWVVGRTGVGKSHYVRTRHSQPDLYLKSCHKWWDGYLSQPFVLLEDLDPFGKFLGHFLKIWADKWGCVGEVKGGVVSLRHRAFYVTSQYEIEDIFKPDDDRELFEAISRRFRRVEISKSMVTEDLEEDSNGHGGD